MRTIWRPARGAAGVTRARTDIRAEVEAGERSLVSRGRYDEGLDAVL